MSDDWVRQRVEAIMQSPEPGPSEALARYQHTRDEIATALQEAIDRGKETGAVEWGLAYAEGRDSVLARLRNPNEALVDAMRRAEPRIDNVVCRKLSRALAATLDEPAPKCSTCNDTGEVDQRLGGAPLYGIVPCPDCTPEKKENS